MQTFVEVTKQKEMGGAMFRGVPDGCLMRFIGDAGTFPPNVVDSLNVDGNRSRQPVWQRMNIPVQGVGEDL
jgi:hypothetical protein